MHIADKAKYLERVGSTEQRKLKLSRKNLKKIEKFCNVKISQFRKYYK
jgi:hypothetical protein